LVPRAAEKLTLRDEVRFMVRDCKYKVENICPMGNPLALSDQFSAHLRLPARSKSK
jgi:hypothetical protein